MTRLILAVFACLVAVTAASYYAQEEPAYHTVAHADNEPYGGYGSYDYNSGYGEDDYDDGPIYDDGYAAPARRGRYGGVSRRPSRSRYNRPAQYSSYDNYDDSNDHGYDNEGDYYGQEEEYAPRRSYGRGRAGRMDMYGRSGTYGYAKPKHHNVPVIIKKKKEKKIKTISVHSGFYVPGGTAIFGKFKDLKSCQKACELTPTCFAGDFNPWLNKCYMHSNITACVQMKAHKQITHFKKIPCTVVETPRGLITLGAAVYHGIEQKHVDNLMDCVKGCANAGGGIAATPDVILQSPQLCFGIDYDFADHKCYFHTLVKICGAADAAVILTSAQTYAKASSVNILLCPIAPMG